jgi:hypothetical protein
MRSAGVTFTQWFHWLLWALMMGSFLALMLWAIPRGVYVVGNTILIFMESATALALLCEVLFTPRAWCTICPMGFTSGDLTKLVSGRAK